jgi:hypothetical protein
MTISGFRRGGCGCYRLAMGKIRVSFSCFLVGWVLLGHGLFGSGSGPWGLGDWGLGGGTVRAGEESVSPPSATESPAADADRILPVAFRIESEIFTGDGDEPVARSLTIFCDGVAWDFLESLPKAADTAGADDGGPASAPGEIILHDPARRRMVLIHPGRNLRTEIEAVTLDRLAASLEAWSRTADEPTVRWAGGPDLAASIEEPKDRSITIEGPRIRYEVDYEPAPSPAAAETYRRFADAAILLKALVQPGGLPPFPRMAINRRVAAALAIPTRVTLRVGAAEGGFGFSTATLRSTHRLHPRVLEEDRDRIESAMAHLVVARPVTLAVYIDEESEAPAGTAGTTRTGGATDSSQKE